MSNVINIRHRELVDLITLRDQQEKDFRTGEQKIAHTRLCIDQLRVLLETQIFENELRADLIAELKEKLP